MSTADINEVDIWKQFPQIPFANVVAVSPPAGLE